MILFTYKLMLNDKIHVFESLEIGMECKKKEMKSPGMLC